MLASGRQKCDSRPSSLLDMNVDVVACVMSSFSMRCPEGARALSLVARTCKLLGLQGYLDGKGKDSPQPSMAIQIAQDACKELGVRRLPLTMGDGWCWPRMLSWLSQAVRVGPLCELKTIEKGVMAAYVKHEDVSDKDAGGVPVEGSVLVLVEPGVYEEGLVIRGEGQRVSIWRCDRDGEIAKNKDLQKVEWRCRCTSALTVLGGSSWPTTGLPLVFVNGLSMSSAGSFHCIHAAGMAAVSFEKCDISAENAAVCLVSGLFTSCCMYGCCIHDGSRQGILIAAHAKATLVRNEIHSHLGEGVRVQEEGSVILKSNVIRLNLRGVSVNDSSATLLSNNIHSNKTVGVAVKGEKSVHVLMKDNTLTDLVMINGRAEATLEDNNFGSGEIKGLDSSRGRFNVLVGDTGTDVTLRGGNGVVLFCDGATGRQCS